MSADGKDGGPPTLAVNLRWTTGVSAAAATAAATESSSQALSSTGMGEGLASIRARAARTLRRISCCFARPGEEPELPLPLAAGPEGDPVSGHKNRLSVGTIFSCQKRALESYCTRTADVFS